MNLEKECRICYSSKNYFCNKLISPCHCKGTMLYIHQFCLYKYFPEKRCNICKSEFNTNIYFILNSFVFLMSQLFILILIGILSMDLIILKLSICLVFFLEFILFVKQIRMIRKFIYIMSLYCVYYIWKNICLLYYFSICDDNICYYMSIALFYIQCNIIQYLFIFFCKYI